MDKKQNMFHLIFFKVALFVCSFLSTQSLAQTETSQKLHTPPEIVEIIEDSKLIYEFTDNEDSPASPESLTILPDNLYLKQDDSGYSLAQFSLSDKTYQLFQEAEEAFINEEFGRAIELYNQMLSIQPEISHVLTLIGDAYFRMGQYETAKGFLLQSIEKNFIDYQAHWFLSSTYRSLGDINSALQELTIAHLLNVNHMGLQGSIRNCRTILNRPWKEWNFEPQYNLSKEGDKVTIKVSEEWLGYAMVKAVWAYEPGYAESVLGEPRGSKLILWPEEMEAVITLLAGNNKLEHINEIIEKGYFNEFITYEVLGKKYPVGLVLQPRENFMRIVEYVNTFH